MIYLIGSLRNPEIPKIAERIRNAGFEVFDDWFAAGPEADDKWRDYERGRGRSFAEALGGLAARHVFSFDRTHLERASIVVLVCPAGKSGHLELGWALGTGKPGYILIDSPDRWDVMYQFATGVYSRLEELIERLKEESSLCSGTVQGGVGIRGWSAGQLRDFDEYHGSNAGIAGVVESGTGRIVPSR